MSDFPEKDALRVGQLTLLPDADGDFAGECGEAKLTLTRCDRHWDWDLYWGEGGHVGGRYYASAKDAAAAVGWFFDAIGFTPKHEWVPVAECGELADGRYRACVRCTLPDWEGSPAEETKHYVRRIEGAWQLLPYHEVTHILSPRLGPIPEAPHG
jgi:hypothetical protein